MATPVIITKDLTKTYGDFTAVDNLNLQVMRGEIFGLLGPNGAGKTTTILMLLGLSEPAKGAARVAGLNPIRDPLEVKRKVGYLPDNVGFYPNLSARRNLSYTAKLNGLSDSESATRIDLLLERVGLAGVGDQDAGTFSRGMRQRLGIADALIKEPEILILDEPTVGIDPEGVSDILDLIKSLKEEDVTVLLSSHLLYQVQAICDRVGIFYQGKLIAHGPLRELAAKLTSSGISIEVGANGWEVEGALRSIPGIAKVDREGEILVVRAERDVRYDISKVLTERGISLWHLRKRGEELDEIYHQYFAAGADGGS